MMVIILDKKLRYYVVKILAKNLVLLIIINNRSGPEWRMVPICPNNKLGDLDHEGMCLKTGMFVLKR